MNRKILWLSFWVTVTYWLGGVVGCAGRGESQNYKALEDDHRPRMEPEQPEYLESGQSAAPRSPDEQSVLESLAAAIRENRAADEAKGERVALAQAQVEQPAEPGEPGEPGGGDAAQPQPVDPPAPPTVIEPAPPDAPDAVDAPPPPDAPDAPAPRDVLDITEPPGDAATAPPTGPSLNGLDRSHWPRIVVGPAVGVTVHNPVYFQDVLLEPDARPVTRAGDVPAQIDSALSGRKAHTWSARTGADLVVQPVKYGLDMLLLPVKAVLDLPWSDARTPEYEGPMAVDAED
jgi:hypothetical protein